MNVYKKGARKEYKICKELKESGEWDIVQRTAGSHSRIDIIAISIKNKKIKLIQNKRTLARNMDYINPQLKSKLEKENKELEGNYKVEFEAR